MGHFYSHFLCCYYYCYWSDCSGWHCCCCCCCCTSLYCYSISCCCYCWSGCSVDCRCCSHCRSYQTHALWDNYCAPVLDTGDGCYVRGCIFCCNYYPSRWNGRCRAAAVAPRPQLEPDLVKAVAVVVGDDYSIDIAGIAGCCYLLRTGYFFQVKFYRPMFRANLTLCVTLCYVQWMWLSRFLWALI